jgi:hypothetical protein
MARPAVKRVSLLGTSALVVALVNVFWNHTTSTSGMTGIMIYPTHNPYPIPHNPQEPLLSCSLQERLIESKHSERANAYLDLENSVTMRSVNFIYTLRKQHGGPLSMSSYSPTTWCVVIVAHTTPAAWRKRMPRLNTDGSEMQNFAADSHTDLAPH